MTQKGSLVSPDRPRFDFSHSKPIEKDEVVKINKIVNEIVNGASDVQTRIMSPKEAVNLGALALFGEKYGDEVRVVFMEKKRMVSFPRNYVVEHMLKTQKKLESLK